MSEPDAISAQAGRGLAVDLQRTYERKLAALDALKQAMLHEALADAL